jgi:hypothetical protein
MAWPGHLAYQEPTGTTAFRRPRAGVVTLELILMLPVWIIMFFALVVFAQLISNRQQLALASRVGAEEASGTVGLDLTVDGDPVPQNVMQVIQDQLESSGITQCKVILEHNVLPASPPPPPTPPIELVSGTCDCPAPPGPNLPSTREYVRVTVYVPVTELTCNLLGSFGLDLSNRYVRQSTTFRYEL